MNVIGFVHEGLGNSSYLVEIGDELAVLVDPDRSVDHYLGMASALGLRIASIFETHLHADFVSGVRELSHTTEADLYLPKGEEARFPHRPVSAGERVRVGPVEVEAIASPGHTPEHLSYVLRDGRQPPLLFSGGALIVGGAARTDLISPDMTEELTRAQYRTLNSAFSALPDETVLYPTHGGGSFCSTGAGGERSSTLGKERAQNPVLSIKSEEEFVRWFPTTFPAAPSYFFRMRAFNREGPRLRREIVPPPPLTPAEFDRARREALIIDARPKEDYAAAHIAGSLSNPYRDGYALWLGWLVPPETPLLFVAGDVPLENVVDQSLLVGYEDFNGWLGGGIKAWTRAGLPLERTELVDAEAARKALLDGAISLDVREPNEFEAGHIPEAIHIPLGQLESQTDRLPKDRPILAYCGHGERASSAVSILERAGLGPLFNLDGGIGAWQDAGYKMATI